MKPTASELALVTIVDDTFLPGALVMLDSFRRHHRWFEGTVVIIHDDTLSAESQLALQQTIDRVQFHAVASSLQQRIDLLVQTRQGLRNSRRRFYSLEVFALRGFDRVLYCDADILFQAPVEDLLQIDAGLIATPDKPALIGEMWGETAPPPRPEARGLVRKSFNSGLMLIRSELLNADTQEALNTLLNPSTWNGTTTGHTDQWLLNVHFYGQVHLVDISYNYILRIQSLLERKYNRSIRKARVLHFNLPVKPWDISRTLQSNRYSPTYPRAEELWFQAYQRLRARQHYRQDTPANTPTYRGAQHDLKSLISSHLFVIAPNISGSTFLKNVLATSRQTWNLRREGQNSFGASGPSPTHLDVPLQWAAHPEAFERLSNPANYNWDVTRRAWYFQAFSRSPHATVFVEKSPPHLLHVAALRDNFLNAKFIFLVRNPYAMAEGILRRKARESSSREEAIAVTARHILTCLKIQRDNISQFSDCGITITYEAMCRDPDGLEEKIRLLEPALEDIYLDQAVEVKGLYHEPLRDMNTQQIARLSGEDRAALETHFRSSRELLIFFNYPLECPNA